MNQKKGELKEIIIKYFGVIIIILLIIFLLGITGKILEIKWEKQERIRLEKIEKQKLIEAEKQKILQEKLDYENYINNVDLNTDNSLTKFVNNKVHFNELSYVPENLVSISSKHIIDGKGGYIKVKKVLKDNLIKLSNDFFKSTNNNIIVVSGYRSYNYQKGIKDRGCPDNLCAKAGFSEHQSGLAIDLYSASSEKNWSNNNNLKKYYSWLKENAWKYGFTNTYQKGLEIDGYEIEPWHWRYVGIKLAKYLQENNLTFAEFYYKRKIEKN